MIDVTVFSNFRKQQRCGSADIKNYLVIRGITSHDQLSQATAANDLTANSDNDPIKLLAPKNYFSDS